MYFFPLYKKEIFIKNVIQLVILCQKKKSELVRGRVVHTIRIS